QAAEQIQIALLPAVGMDIELFTINMGAMQRIEQLVVAGRKFEVSNDLAAHVGIVDAVEIDLAEHDHRRRGVPLVDLAQALGQRTMVAGAQQYAADHPAALPALARLGRGEPAIAIETAWMFAKELENDAEIMAALMVIVDQHHLFFCPHRL